MPSGVGGKAVIVGKEGVPELGLGLVIDAGAGAPGMKICVADVILRGFDVSSLT